MAGKIPREFIQELIARIDLVDVVDARVPLRQVGSNFTARCPFHNEKTPSFTVSRDKQFYHCFGCGAHGNVIDFLMGYDHLTFVEAVESLAALAGLKIPEEAQRAAAESGVKMANAIRVTGCFSVLRASAQSPPCSSTTVAYLKDRGSVASLSRYRLGYAPPGWQIYHQSFRRSFNARDSGSKDKV